MAAPRLFQPLAVVTLSASMSTGCPATQEGALLFELTLPGGIVSTAVHATCTGGDERTERATLPVSAPATGVGPSLALWTGLAPATGRTCAVETLDGACGGSASEVEVAPERLTRVELVLQCGDRLPVGAVRLAAHVNVCPGIQAIDVAPANGTVGAAQVVSARVSNLDGDPLAFLWTVSPEDVGSIDDPTGNPIRFTCRRPGTVAVTLGVDDGNGCGFGPDAEVPIRETQRWVCLPTGD